MTSEEPSTAGEQQQARGHGVRSAVIWSYVLTIGRYSVTATVTLFMAILLTPTAFGVMALAMVWVWFAQVLSQHGPAQAVTQRELVTSDHYNAAFWVTTATSTLLGVGLAVLAPLWAHINRVPELAPVCWALAPAIVLNGLIAIPEAVMRRELRFKALSVRVLAGGLISGIVGIGVALAGYGVWALVAQQLTVSVVSLITVWVAVSWRPSFRSISAPLKDLRRFSSHSVAEFLAYAFASRADALLLGSFFGPAPLGLYRFSNRLVEMVMELCAGGLNQVTLPHLSRYSEDRSEFAGRLNSIIHLGMAIALPALGILAGVATPLLAVLGPEWSDAVPALRVLCLAGAFMVLGTILAPGIQALGRPGTGALLGWGEAICMIASMIVVGTSLSGSSATRQVLAMATTLLCVQVVFVTITALVTYLHLLRQPIGPLVRQILPAALAGALAAGAGWSLAMVMPALPAFVTLILVAIPATILAGGVILLLDRWALSKTREVIARLRRRVPQSPAEASV